MPIPARYDIKTQEGDTYIFTIKVDGNKTLATPKFEINNNVGTSVLELTIGSGIAFAYNVVLDESVWTITITATQTAALDPTIIYTYDFQTDTSGVILTYLAGLLSIQSEVAV